MSGVFQPFQISVRKAHPPLPWSFTLNTPVKKDFHLVAFRRKLLVTNYVQAR